ncbi:hypothetical protein HZS55_07720 [Halosimplex rubrum]|uniref:Envelope protein N-terminal domain-containing protein n=1 Tax=Halosimplex rubrum TaxID=869889 RepID=A0A7D5SZK2_9EURY|nr:hypothetical protein [Halosimplex rubrum]QLH77188.1 hypothetical protein HZS55_07720 [Halosimplex rubrum]
MIGRRARRAREAMGPTVLALLLVLSLAAPAAVGLASAETVSKTVDAEGAAYVAADVSDVSGSFDVKIWVSPAPGGGQTLVYEDTHNAANTADIPAYRNSKAYQNVTVEISGSGVPSDLEIGTGSAFERSDWRNKDVWTSSGADRDFNCGPMERVSQVVNPAIEITDCNALPATTTVNTTGLDAEETMLDIYQSLATSADAADNWQTTISNRLEDTETVSLVNHGKPAYIRAYNNGLGEAAAEDAAIQNITEYYSVMDRNTVSEWNRHVATIKRMRQVSQEETGVPDSYVHVIEEDVQDGDLASSFTPHELNITGFGTRQFTLENGSSVEVSTIEVTFWNLQTQPATTETHVIGPSTGTVFNATDGNSNGPAKDVDIRRINVSAPQSNHDAQTALWFKDFATPLSRISTQTDSAISEMQSVVSGTWDQLETGEINSSDLVTPAMVAGSYSQSSDFSGYAAASLASLGVSIPESYSQLGHMNVSFADGTTDRGLVVAQSNPPGGSFQVGTEYAPGNISGAVWLIDSQDSEIREVEQAFTIDSAVNTTGGSLDKVRIEKRTYETTSANELSNLYQQIAKDQAEIDARLANMDGGGGGGGLLGGGNQTIVLVLVAGAVAVVVLGNGGRR